MKLSAIGVLVAIAVAVETASAEVPKATIEEPHELGEAPHGKPLPHEGLPGEPPPTGKVLAVTGFGLIFGGGLAFFGGLLVAGDDVGRGSSSWRGPAILIASVSAEAIGIPMFILGKRRADRDAQIWQSATLVPMPRGAVLRWSF